MAKKAAVGTPATVALTKAGVEFTVHTFESEPTGTSYGLAAAAALGVDPARVFKTLMAEVDGNLVVAVVPVSQQLDLKALASAARGKRAAMADPALAERTTGYVVGGISPLGQRKRLPTFIDSSALDHKTMFVSAGRRGADLELAPADLIALLAATLAPLGR